MVWVIVPGLYVAALLSATSENPVSLPTTDFCHLYSRIPVCPVGSETPVVDEVTNGVQPTWSPAIDPPLTGSVQAGVMVAFNPVGCVSV